MGQFTVHQNANKGTAVSYPYLLDVQSDSVERLPTCVAIPIAASESLPFKRITRLMPEVKILGVSFVLVTQELAGIPRKQLGEAVADLSENRSEIINALDMLFTGI